jgi:DNA-binding NarL/FixJ family response regulator
MEMIQESSKITKREWEILTSISHGYTTKEIASQLSISDHTVNAHRKNLIRKFNVLNASSLVRKGFELGILKA